MKTKIIESAEWIAAYAIDYIGKTLIACGLVFLCFLPALLG